jgi:hypothetical protein
MLAAAIYAGCSSDDTPAAGPQNDGGAPDGQTTKPDAGDGGSAVVTNPICGTDLDVDKIFKHLSCTGLYANYTNKTVASDAMPYKPSTEFWSDGAEKQRWLHIPPGQKIDSSDMNEWKFPAGTKVWKEFKLHGTLTETRYFEKLADGTWNNTTYRWAADGSDAQRLEGGELIDGGGPNGEQYEIPTTSGCGECHSGRKDFMLGIDAISLGLPDATGETLAKLVADGLLTAPPPVTTLAYPTATAAQGGDKTGPALAWLNVNCGTTCHNPNSNAAAQGTGFWYHLNATDLMPVDGGPLTVDKLQVFTTAVCKPSNRNDPAAPATKLKLIDPGQPTKSYVSIVSGQRKPAADEQMPPDYTHAVDTNGHKLLDDWITAMTMTCQ